MRSFDVQMGQSTSPTKSAPCQQYLELQAFEVLEKKVLQFEEAQFKEDIESIKKEIKEEAYYVFGCIPECLSG